MWPSEEKHAPVASPTYPVPITAIFATFPILIPLAMRNLGTGTISPSTIELVHSNDRAI